MFVLDTNTLIYFFKGMGKVATVLLNTPPQAIAIPTIVLFELELGLAKSNHPDKRSAQLSEFLSHVTLWSFGAEEARICAALRAVLEQRGTMIGPYDLLIAGTALTHHATLVTHNLREFERIDGLALVDWY